MVTFNADLANRRTQPLHFANRRYVKELSTYRKQSCVWTATLQDVSKVPLHFRVGTHSTSGQRGERWPRRAVLKYSCPTACPTSPECPTSLACPTSPACPKSPVCPTNPVFPTSSACPTSPACPTRPVCPTIPVCPTSIFSGEVCGQWDIRCTSWAVQTVKSRSAQTQPQPLCARDVTS